MKDIAETIKDMDFGALLNSLQLTQPGFPQRTPFLGSQAHQTKGRGAAHASCSDLAERKQPLRRRQSYRQGLKLSPSWTFFSK